MPRLFSGEPNTVGVHGDTVRWSAHYRFHFTVSWITTLRWKSVVFPYCIWQSHKSWRLFRWCSRSGVCQVANQEIPPTSHSCQWDTYRRPLLIDFVRAGNISLWPQLFHDTSFRCNWRGTQHDWKRVWSSDEIWCRFLFWILQDVFHWPPAGPHYLVLDDCSSQRAVQATADCYH